jgi:hypothetical protein
VSRVDPSVELDQSVDDLGAAVASGRDVEVGQEPLAVTSSTSATASFLDRSHQLRRLTEFVQAYPAGDPQG